MKSIIQYAKNRRNLQFYSMLCTQNLYKSMVDSTVMPSVNISLSLALNVTDKEPGT